MTAVQCVSATMARFGLALLAAGLTLSAAGVGAAAALPATGTSRSMPAVAPVAAATEHPVLAARASRADFAREEASPDARRIADWILDSRDNRGTPFVIVDKIDSRVFVFDARGRLRGASPALSRPGTRRRFGAGYRWAQDVDHTPGRSAPPRRADSWLTWSASPRRTIVWVDYEAAVALHPVVAIPKERRLERLASGARRTAGSPTVASTCRSSSSRTW